MAGAANLLDPVSEAEDALRAGASLNGSARGGGAKSLNGSTPQRAQQGEVPANGKHGTGQTQQGVVSRRTNGTSIRNGSGQMRVASQNGSAQLDQTQREPPANNGSADRAIGQFSPGLPQTTGLPAASRTSANGAAPKTSRGRDTSDEPSAKRPASALRSSASDMADDAMTAAIAGIHSQQADARPETPPGGKAIPTPSLNASPRIKSALLAAQEYRKKKAAKTAALAIAAAQAAVKQSTLNDVP